MIISIFAENISSVKDTDSCREYYLPTIQKYINEKEYLQELDIVKGASQISLDMRDDKAILEYGLILPPLNDNRDVVQKRMHAYIYYDDYCFDFHISKFDFHDPDRQKFYDIIDSIKFVPLMNISEVNGSNRLKNHLASRYPVPYRIRRPGHKLSHHLENQLLMSINKELVFSYKFKFDEILIFILCIVHLFSKTVREEWRQ